MVLSTVFGGLLSKRNKWILVWVGIANNFLSYYVSHHNIEQTELKANKKRMMVSTWKMPVISLLWQSIQLMWPWLSAVLCWPSDNSINNTKMYVYNAQSVGGGCCHAHNDALGVRTITNLFLCFCHICRLWRFRSRNAAGRATHRAVILSVSIILESGLKFWRWHLKHHEAVETAKWILQLVVRLRSWVCQPLDLPRRLSAVLWSGDSVSMVHAMHLCLFFLWTHNTLKCQILVSLG